MELSLKRLQDRIAEQGRRRLNTLLGLDFGASGIKAVRLRKTKEGVQLMAADILPATDLLNPERPDIPRPLMAYYASLCTTMEGSAVRVFSEQIKEGQSIEKIACENLGVSPESSRVAYKLIDRRPGNRESFLLGAAMPEKTVKHYLELFSEEAPALHSLELSALSAFSAFWMGGGRPPADEVVCLIEGGERYISVGFFYKNRLLLVNRFPLGAETIRLQVEKDIDVESDMAQTILLDGSFDISKSVQTVFGAFMRQLSIYREFIERQNKTRLSRVYLSGGMASLPWWGAALTDLLDVELKTWDPFSRVRVPSEMDMEQFKGQEGRFAGALGAALAGLENG